MPQPLAGFQGWKTIRRAAVHFYRCPKCSHVQESLSYGSDHLATCYGCGFRTAPEQFGTARVKRQIAVCGGCGEAVAIVGRNHSIGGPFYLCGFCGIAVAMEHGNRVVSPNDVLTLAWNPHISERAQDLGPWRWAVCKSKRERLVVQILVLLAQAEEESFMYPSERESRAMVCFDDSNYIGYLMWSDMRSERTGSREPVLHQVYVRAEWRRQGIATGLIRTWADQFAFPIASSFGVESPNEKTIGALVKLGYASDDPPQLCYRWAGR